MEKEERNQAIFRYIMRSVQDVMRTPEFFESAHNVKTEQIISIFSMFFYFYYVAYDKETLYYVLKEFAKLFPLKDITPHERFDTVVAEVFDRLETIIIAKNAASSASAFNGELAHMIFGDAYSASKTFFLTIHLTGFLKYMFQ